MQIRPRRCRHIKDCTSTLDGDSLLSNGQIAWKLNQQSAVSNMNGSEADHMSHAYLPRNLLSYYNKTQR